MAQKLNELAVGYAAASVGAAMMLLLGLLGPMGFYRGAMGMMQQGHMFFWAGPVGILAGMVEAAIVSFIVGYAFGWLYNYFA